MHRWRFRLKTVAWPLGAAVAFMASQSSPAFAQLGGLGRSGIGSSLGQLVQRPTELLSQTASDLSPDDLVNLRIQRLTDLVRAHPKALERDDHGAPVVRGQVLTVAPAGSSLDIAKAAGFLRLSSPMSGQDDDGIVVLEAPPGLSIIDAVRRLRTLDPLGVYDFNHIYFPGAETGTQSLPVPPATNTGPYPSVRIGLIDTGVEAHAGVFSQVRLEQRAFAGGGLKPSAHGTEVASLLVGSAPRFHGSAPGASLFAADVYGDDAAGGAADALVRALFWLASQKVQVINISLTGPPNAALGAGIRAVTARGVLVVAAVGNDGPAAPPAFPASYPEVVAVTGVDGRGRVLLEAGRAAHLDFAAPGADMAAASLGGRYFNVRGTSFAAPVVAGELAILAERLTSAPASLDALAAAGRPGRGYGRGLVGMDVRTLPRAVQAGAAQ